MSEQEKIWEEVELKDATHVEIDEGLFEINERGGTVKRYVDFGWIEILVGENKLASIPQEAFPLLGIRCLRKVKPKPIEFDALVVVGFLSTEIAPYLVCSPELFGKKFKCVEILEEE
jgi:hypothetical protein